MFDYTDGTSSDKIGPIKGRDGENGKDGLTPILTLSESGDLSVKYGESGAVISLGNIKGAKGDKGDEGAKGSNGVDGKSAYELYIAAHPEYTGTPEEWLAALKGEKGDTGRGIAKTEIIDGYLWVTYTDDLENPMNVGKVSENNNNECLKFTRLSDGTLSVSIKEEYKTFVKKVVIPSEYYGFKVTRIGNGGFSGCEILEEVILPDTITEIGGFRNCKLLRKINFPNSLNKIGVLAFESCESLTGVDLPNNLQEIGGLAFDNCNIEEITIPASVKIIGRSAFPQSFKKANFEKTTGWRMYEDTIDYVISESDLKTPEKAAELLTKKYYSQKSQKSLGYKFDNTD